MQQDQEKKLQTQWPFFFLPDELSAGLLQYKRPWYIGIQLGAPEDQPVLRIPITSKSVAVHTCTIVLLVALVYKCLSCILY